MKFITLILYIFISFNTSIFAQITLYNASLKDTSIQELFLNNENHLIVASEIPLVHPFIIIDATDTLFPIHNEWTIVPNNKYNANNINIDLYSENKKVKTYTFSTRNINGPILTIDSQIKEFYTIDDVISHPKITLTDTSNFLGNNYNIDRYKIYIHEKDTSYLYHYLHIHTDKDTIEVVDPESGIIQYMIPIDEGDTYRDYFEDAYFSKDLILFFQSLNKGTIIEITDVTCTNHHSQRRFLNTSVRIRL